MTPAPACMHDALTTLSQRQDLSRTQAESVMGAIMRGEVSQVHMAAWLMGLAGKGIVADEVVGAAQAMRAAMTPVPTRRTPLLDTCGTGGSGVSRLNVSTAVALCVAACGVSVAKHGNRGASSPSGSADVLQALGVKVDTTAATVSHCLNTVGVGFLFAQALHPAMRHAAPVRAALGVRTLFNLLGPLTNPAGATRQLLGVFAPQYCELMARALGQLGSERVWVVHGFRAGVRAASDAPAGIDDLSPEGETLAVQWRHGTLTHHVLTPAMAELGDAAIADLAGGDPAHNAAALHQLLAGASSPYRQAVLWSGSVALLAAREGELADLPGYARELATAIDQGHVAHVLADLVACSHANHGVSP